MVGLRGFEPLTTPLNSLLVTFLEGEPRSLGEIRQQFNTYNTKNIENCLRRLWKKELILRTKRSEYARNKIFKGRNGILMWRLWIIIKCMVRMS